MFSYSDCASNLKCCERSRGKLCVTLLPGRPSHCPLFAFTLFIMETANLPFVNSPVILSSGQQRNCPAIS